MTLLIVSGDYSDYQVHGAFKGTRAEADAFVAELNKKYGYSWNEYDVEETYDLTADSLAFATRLDLQVVLYDNGTEQEARESTGPVVEILTPDADRESFYRSHRTTVSWSRYLNHGSIGSGDLRARGIDHEHVRKRFSDALAALRTDDSLRKTGTVRFFEEED